MLQHLDPMLKGNKVQVTSSYDHDDNIALTTDEQTVYQVMLLLHIFCYYKQKSIIKVALLSILCNNRMNVRY